MLFKNLRTGQYYFVFDLSFGEIKSLIAQLGLLKCRLLLIYN